VVGDQVAERVEPGLPDVLERHAPRPPVAPDGVRDLRQQRPPGAVGLERAVPHRAEHRADPAPLPGREQRLAAVDGDDPVVDLVRRRDRVRAVRPVGRPSTFSAPNAVRTGSRPSPSTAPARDSTSSCTTVPSIW
jgi:hypothetical protein